MIRVLFDEEESARVVEARLRRDGFEVVVRREAFAGEDDDADHPWALRTDAPPMMVELLVEEYDGWVEYDEDPALAPSPLELPGMPKRLHRPQSPDAT